MIVIESQSKDLVDLITAISTALAVFFAAFSAWTSMQSAKAAKAAVEEARLARRAELAPRLVLEKEFLDFRFYWPSADSLDGEVAFLARKDLRDNGLSSPTFVLQNFGQSSALEVTIVWELDDPNGDFAVPELFESAGISIQRAGTPLDNGHQIPSLSYLKPDGRGISLPLYRKWTSDIPSCSPGQSRTIDFPMHLLNVFFLRGLQLGAIARTETEIVLSACVSCYSVDDERYERTFKWKVVPFSYGEVSPVVVHGHFFELAIHPKPAGSRVA